jgi:hypothetical protein
MIRFSILGGEAWRIKSADDKNAHHTLHCIDWIRQALLCNADLTLDSTEDLHLFGQGSTHQCRDFSKVKAWAEQHRYRAMDREEQQ